MPLQSGAGTGVTSRLISGAFARKMSDDYEYAIIGGQNGYDAF